jgi:hypothetical protein
MRITWINPAPVVIEDGKPTSERACVRLRCALPAEALLLNGHGVRMFSFLEVPEAVGVPGFLEQDAFVFGKALVDYAPFVQMIRANSKAKIIVDICDNVFAPPEDGLAPFYQSLLPLADGVVTSSEALLSAIATKIPSGKPVFTIPEAVEGARTAPKFAPEATGLKILWFGYPNNLALLVDLYPQLLQFQREHPIEIKIVTTLNVLRLDVMDQMAQGMRVSYEEWSKGSMASALDWCDVVLIPSDASPGRMTRSPNRLVTSLWAGRMVVAYPLPSYEPFSKAAFLSQDVVTGLKELLEERDGVVERISRGQELVAGQYGVERVAQQWEDAVMQVVGTA